MKRAIVEKDFEYRGYKCSVILQLMGHRCGYVALKPNDKYFKIDYTLIPIYCHGGLTYGEDHLYEHTDPDVYWIGWDYAHYRDGKVSISEMKEAFKDDAVSLNCIKESEESNPGYLYSGYKSYSLQEVIDDCKDVVDQIIYLNLKSD